MEVNKIWMNIIVDVWGMFLGVFFFFFFGRWLLCKMTVFRATEGTRKLHCPNCILGGGAGGQRQKVTLWSNSFKMPNKQKHL